MANNQNFINFCGPNRSCYQVRKSAEPLIKFALPPVKKLVGENGIIENVIYPAPWSNPEHRADEDGKRQKKSNQQFYPKCRVYEPDQQI
ncbi:hypothetical protein HUS71_23920 [Pandoraea nosoerga]|nr:hypothetical protein [Pandoraea nosoerga]